MTGITLEARDLTKTFTSTNPPTEVLRGLDVRVCEGEMLAVMGASGSGKSTLLHNISGMDRPTTGSVVLEGRELLSLNDAEMSRVRLTRMGFVFQQAFFLPNLSIGDNILLPALKAEQPGVASYARWKRHLPTYDATRGDRGGSGSGSGGGLRARAAALMERFGISHVRDRSVTQVSGGQLQRAAICRALVCDPAIVFADEPTGALNSSASAEVMDVFGEAHAEGATIVMVTHDPVCAARADRVIYLRDGQQVDERTLGTWRASEGAERVAALQSWLSGHGF